MTDRVPILSDPPRASTPRRRARAALGLGRLRWRMSVCWRVWAPLALRGLALGIALLGLAAIGVVVSQVPSLGSPTVARAGFELGALSSRALADLGAAVGSSTPATPGRSGSPSDAPSGSAAPVPAVSPPVSAPADAPPCPSVSGAERGPPPPVPPPEGGGASASEHPVSLNRASVAELRRLPGVGAKRAQAIVELRDRLGCFQRPSDLLRIKGIGPRTLERLLPHVVLD